MPPEEWADRLDQFVAALLNCVEIYVPWNLIEARPGCFDFTGSCDLVRFLELCRDRQLYVFLRPGPYICAEWDLGGLPAWLLEEGASLRSADPVFLGHVERYFNEIFSRIGRFQRSVSSDGPIILIQVENEFWMSHPDGRHYLEEIRRLLLAAGASVPLTDCNMLYNTPPTLHTINGGWNYPANFQRMRREFPGQPLFAAEFHCGWFITTARPLAEQHKVESLIFRDSLRYLSRGAMMSRYMFIGGTNFGNWGARAAAGEFLTASYDFVAPVTEGGGRSEKFYWARLAHRLELLFSAQLAQSPRPCEAVYLHAHPHAITRQTPAGDLVFVFKTIDDEPAEEDVPLICGRWRRLTARFTPEITVRIIPVDYLISPGVRIDFCEAQLFHLRTVAGDCELFFYDQAGSLCEISLNGLTRSVAFPAAGDSPVSVVWEDGLRLHLFTLNQALRFQADASTDAYEIEARPASPPPIIAEWRPCEISPAVGDTLAVAFTQPEQRDAFDPTTVVFAADPVPLGPVNLHFAPLTPPREQASHPVSAGQPSWFAGGFRLGEIPKGGLLLDLAAQSRGRLWLNGRLLARFWQPTPQSLYWAPASWLESDNDLVIFDEEGICPPCPMRLSPQTHGPFRRFPIAIFPEAMEPPAVETTAAPEDAEKWD